MPVPSSPKRTPETRAATLWAYLSAVVPLADKALKSGTVSLPGIEGGTVRLHTEDAPAHPMHEAFGRQAQSLNGEIDALNRSTAGAARWVIGCSRRSTSVPNSSTGDT